jgi:outer membrane receptor protein involved in Fe transport
MYYPYPPKKRLGFTVSVMILLGQLSVASQANTAQLEEIVITAALMEADIDHLSVTSVTESDIGARGAAHFEDLLTLVPNLSASAGASRQRFFQIRGIGERSQFVEPINPSVILLQDGIDISGLGSALTTFDTSQVEIFRGPQGAIMGAGALAGLISTETQTPTSNANLRVAMGMENYSGRRLEVVANAPLSAALSARLAHQHFASDGWIENTYLGVDDTNNRDEQTTRFALRHVSGQYSVDMKLNKVEVNNGYDAFSLDNTRETLSDRPGEDSLDMTSALIRWNRVGEDYTSMIQVSNVSTDTVYSYDEDWSYVGIRPFWEYSSFDAYARDLKRRTLEWRLTPSNSDATDWVTGVYARQEEEALDRDYTYLDAPFGSVNKADTLALYGQLSHSFTDDITLTLGTRLEQREVNYRDSAGVKERFDDNYWTGNASVNWRIHETGAVFATISRGVRAGGVNPSLSSTLLSLVDESDVSAYAAATRFDEESLLNTELGYRFSSVNNLISGSITLFNMDRSDQQVKGSLVIPRSDGSTSFTDFTDNAASGTNRGLEATLDWRVAPSLGISAFIARLDAQFDTYVNIDGTDLSDRDQPQAPGDQYRLSAIWDMTKNVSASLEVTGRDAFFLSDRHDVRSPSARLVNANIAWQFDAWEVTVWGRNLQDAKTVTRGFGTFGNDPRKEYVLEPYYQFGEPRTVGATVRYQLGDRL